MLRNYIIKIHTLGASTHRNLWGVNYNSKNGVKILGTGVLSTPRLELK